ncbi:OprD family outer membrane porin [Pseudomonas abieticivorans]|uniref:OprD family outer membrane porin n=1 Tax=Pseudomonas abieticivorans TaxID=2931382 RepID=UPI0020BDF594|nr:OprD family outer membrane porin [Pseudomonas sp. PIA16]
MRAFMTTGGLLCAGLLAPCATEVRADGFLESSTGTLALRNYYFNHDNRSAGNDRVEWAQGMLLDLRSGYTQGSVGFGLDALGLLGLKLDSTPAKAGTGLLPVHDDGHAANDFSSLGLTAKVRFAGVVLKTGTLLPKIPVVSYNDGRLLPQTYQGTQFEYTGVSNLYLLGGRLDQSKLRNSSDNVDLIPTGYKGAEHGDFYFAGGTYTLNKQLAFTYYYGELENFYRQHFAGAVHKTAVGPGQLTTDLRYFNSAGAGAAYNGAADADMFSGLLSYRLGGNTFAGGYQQVSGDSALPYLNGGATSSFTSPGVSKFILQDEKTWMLRYDYDFAALAVPGLAFMVRYYKGFDAHYRGLPADEHELDTSLKYVIQGGTFKGLGAEFRNTAYRSNVLTSWDYNRLYLTYDIKLW